MNDTLVVAYSADDNYASFLGFSLRSLIDSQLEFKKIHVYVMDCGISKENQKKLLKMTEKSGNEITFFSMEEKLVFLKNTFGFDEREASYYARLLITDIVSEDVSKVIYLDCDTIVQGSLREFWNTDMGENLIGACRDTVDYYFAKAIGLPEGEVYVNSGVLVINLSLWRELDVKEQFLEVIRKFGGSVPHRDQGVINSVCIGKKQIMPLKYNLTSNHWSFSVRTMKKMYNMKTYYSQKEVDQALVNPVIIHFTTGLVGRPWEEGCSHPLSELFWVAVKKSPWPGFLMRPDSRKKSLKVFAWVYEYLPIGLFEFLYRNLSFLLHIGK